MGNVTRINNGRSETPEETVVRAYALTGFCDQGFLLGHVAFPLPAKDLDPAAAFPAVVQSAFAGVQGLKWGIVMGPGCVAKT